MIKTARQLKDLIRNLSKDKSADAQILMRNYMMERFLERISLSEYRDKFILKGGMLVAAMVGLDARSTMDIDATVKSVWDSLTAADWKHYEYIGSRDRIANETFILTAADDSQYQVSFAINTYQGKAAHLETTLTAVETDTYDHRLESLKITLKDLLLPNWNQCTWLLDEQSATLCKEGL